MSKRRQRKVASTPGPAKFSALRGHGFLAGVGLVVVVVATAAVLLSMRGGKPAGLTATSAGQSNPPALSPSVPLPTNEVAHSLMSTVELDFGGRPTSIQDALKEIERRSEPDDGVGRTFAMLDADGGLAPNGKLHLQMHLSMEKPGVGALIFRRTGEVLWKSRIVASTNGPPPKQLTIYMADAAGKSALLDGSKGASRVLDVPIDKSTARVRDLWPDGAEHEFTFLYSVCGCPVKAKVRRIGETTARTTELPVMFPDDPAALAVIRQLMGWQSND